MNTTVINTHFRTLALPQGIRALLLNCTLRLCDRVFLIALRFYEENPQEARRILDAGPNAPKILHKYFDADQLHTTDDNLCIATPYRPLAPSSWQYKPSRRPKTNT